MGDLLEELLKIWKEISGERTDGSPHSISISPALLFTDDHHEIQSGIGPSQTATTSRSATRLWVEGERQQ